MTPPVTSDDLRAAATAIINAAFSGIVDDLRRAADLIEAQASALAAAERCGMERAAQIVEDLACRFGRAECCGIGYGYPPECCADPLYMVSDRAAAAAIRDRMRSLDRSQEGAEK